MDYEASRGLSRKQIRELAIIFRRIFKIKTLYFPVMKVLNALENKYPNNFYYLVEDDNLFEEGVMAHLDLEEEDLFCMHIRESVYEGALDGRRDYLGFICHEISHFLLVFICGISPKAYMVGNRVIYERTVNDRDIPKFKSMEWQAKALCGELMIPFDRCCYLTRKQIAWMTKSSTQQIDYFINVVVEREKEKDFDIFIK